MSEKIRLVQGDTKPYVTLSLNSVVDGRAIDVSGAATVVMKFRKVGSSTLTDTITCTKLTGRLMEDGSVQTAAPYDVAGAGGRVQVQWNSLTLATAEGDYEGEVIITFADGTIQTVYDRLKFRVRADF